MRTTTSIFLILLLAGCGESGLPSGAEELFAGSETPVWVSRTFVGGKQCDPDDTYTPPDTRKLLEEHRITVMETAIVPMARCRACWICPSYAAIHYALIPEKDLKQAETLGFRLSYPPMNIP
ncbi:MAG TPA: hypothetical protein VNN76_02010 [Bacteroidota bacterium]|nr:hypothetical protein [Bacteroidota bacterium]